MTWWVVSVHWTDGTALLAVIDDSMRGLFDNGSGSSLNTAWEAMIHFVGPFTSEQAALKSTAGVVPRARLIEIVAAACKEAA